MNMAALGKQSCSIVLMDVVLLFSGLMKKKQCLYFKPRPRCEFLREYFLCLEDWVSLFRYFFFPPPPFCLLGDLDGLCPFYSANDPFHHSALR